MNLRNILLPEEFLHPDVESPKLSSAYNTNYYPEGVCAECQKKYGYGRSAIQCRECGDMIHKGQFLDCWGKHCEKKHSKNDDNYEFE